MLGLCLGITTKQRLTTFTRNLRINNSRSNIMVSPRKLFVWLIKHARPWITKETPEGPRFYGVRLSFKWGGKRYKSSQDKNSVVNTNKEKTND